MMKTLSSLMKKLAAVVALGATALSFTGCGGGGGGDAARYVMTAREFFTGTAYFDIKGTIAYFTINPESNGGYFNANGGAGGEVVAHPCKITAAKTTKTGEATYVIDQVDTEGNPISAVLTVAVDDGVNEIYDDEGFNVAFGVRVRILPDATVVKTAPTTVTFRFNFLDGTLEQICAFPEDAEEPEDIWLRSYFVIKNNS